MTQDSKEPACNAGDLGSIPESGRSLEKEMATHSSILAWRIPWREERGAAESDTTEQLRTFSLFTFNYAKRKVGKITRN